LADRVLEQRLKPTFESFVSAAFEEAARVHGAQLARTGRLSFLSARVGAWWDRTGEVDVVAVSEVDRALLLGECKWSTRPIGTNVLEHLKQVAQPVIGLYPDSTVTYALMARAGFTPAMQTLAEREGGVITVDEMLAG